MTLRQLLEDHLSTLPQYYQFILIWLLVPPLLVLLLRVLHGKGQGGASPWRYGYALLVFLTAVPGVCMACLLAYGLVFGQGSLLDLQISLLFLVVAPVVSMVVTLVLMAQVVNLNDVPGFGRLSGLIAILGISFLVVLLLRRLHFWVVSSIWGMLAAGTFFYSFIRWGMRRLFSVSSSSKEEKPPSFPPSI